MLIALQALAKCTWNTEQGQKMGNNLECVVHRGAAELGIGEIPEDNDFRFADWCAAHVALLMLLLWQTLMHCRILLLDVGAARYVSPGHCCKRLTQAL